MHVNPSVGYTGLEGRVLTLAPDPKCLTHDELYSKLGIQQLFTKWYGMLISLMGKEKVLWLNEKEECLSGTKLKKFLCSRPMVKTLALNAIMGYVLMYSF